MLLEAQHNKTKITKVFNFWQIVAKYTYLKYLLKDTGSTIPTWHTNTYSTGDQQTLSNFKKKLTPFLRNKA